MPSKINHTDGKRKLHANYGQAGPGPHTMRVASDREKVVTGGAWDFDGRRAARWQLAAGNCSGPPNDLRLLFYYADYAGINYAVLSRCTGRY
eukprot:g7748.t1